MATFTALTPVHFGGRGAIDEFAIKVVDMTGHATGGCKVDGFENPFGEDMLILRAYVAITTIDSDGDIDIGLADKEDGTNVGEEIVGSMIQSATAIHEYLIHTIAATGVSPLIWKAANAAHTAVDSWICSYQNTSVDASDLRYNLILVVAREADYN